MTKRLSILTCLLSCCANVSAQDHPVDVQALIGAVRWEDRGTVQTGTGEEADVDLSDSPFIGIAGQMPLVGESLTLGFEAGAAWSWWKRDARWTYANGQATVSVDVSGQLVDLSTGLYLETKAVEPVRIYAGAGPLFMMAWNNDGAEYYTIQGGGTAVAYSSDYDSSIGWYGRTGVEFRMRDSSYMGVTFRYVEADLDFGGELGRMELAGYQGMISYTQHF